MRHQESRFKGLGDFDLFMQCWLPEGDPKAVIGLVHGIGEHSSRYPKLVEKLAPHGYAIWSFDLRGHGRSQGKRGFINSWNEYRQDVQLFQEKVQEQYPADMPFFIMGHSMGGLTVLDYVQQNGHKIDGVIVSAPALAQTGTSPALMLFARILSKIVPGFTLNTGLDPTTISRDQTAVQAYMDDPLVHSLGTARLGAELDDRMNWVNEHAADMKLPLLILHGEADRIVPVASSQVYFEKVSSSHKKRIVYQDGYHESHNDLHADQAVEDVLAWLEAFQVAS